ncbi:MAG: site-specific DNA-methyltransferase [Chloroflexi bacterium]|nr:site-specific DNA-methyltransferase [Chloroflexota bacterium]
MNKLYYGDCLTIMREKMTPQSVDIVYLDPPFNSNEDYNAIYKDETGRPLPDQVEAYTDTWELDEARAWTIQQMPVILSEHGVNGHNADFLSTLLSGLSSTLPDMAAYLAYMTERLLWIRRMMKPTAGVFLHCDDTASHYLKIVMDVIFGAQNYRNEITWKRRQDRHNLARKTLGRTVDTIFWYGMSPDHKYNAQYLPYSPEYIRSAYRHTDSRGTYRLLPCTNESGGNKIYEFRGVSRAWRFKPSRMQEMYDADMLVQARPGSPFQYKKYLDDAKGIKLDNLWVDIPGARGNERLGYPTQKPVALLERIIEAGSNKGDLVFDPFCGCATTIEAASKLNRRWIGIDITIHAIKRVARRRLQDRLHLTLGKDYVIEGVPQNWEGAFELWNQDTYQFQKWCVEQVEGFVNVKKTADDGIDGRIYFAMPGEAVLQSMALEVKGGENLSINHVRQMKSVLMFDNVQMAGLITLREPGKQQMKNFRQTMAMAGHVEIDGKVYPRIQLLTVAQILDGARFAMPSPAGRTASGYDSDLWNVPHSQS